MSRIFTLVKSTANVSTTKCKSDTPLEAAKKMAHKIFDKAKRQTVITFTLRNNGKVYSYKATKTYKIKRTQKFDYKINIKKIQKGSIGGVYNPTEHVYSLSKPEPDDDKTNQCKSIKTSITQIFRILGAVHPEINWNILRLQNYGIPYSISADVVNQLIRVKDLCDEYKNTNLTRYLPLKRYNEDIKCLLDQLAGKSPEKYSMSVARGPQGGTKI